MGKIKHILKRYKLLLLIVFIALNFLGFQLIKEIVVISDALEHIESETIAQNLKHKDLMYTIFIDFILILDFALLSFLIYSGMRQVFKRVKN